MIDVTKLRIGNVVEYLVQDEVDPRKKYWLPNVIDVEDILWLSQNPNDENYRYMKLSHGDFLRFGFEHYEAGLFGNNYRRKGMRFQYAKWKFTFVNLPIVEVEFAHELQNLFLDCTGEKLEFSNDAKFKAKPSNEKAT